MTNPATRINAQAMPMFEGRRRRNILLLLPSSLRLTGAYTNANRRRLLNSILQVRLARPLTPLLRFDFVTNTTDERSAYPVRTFDRMLRKTFVMNRTTT